jgi:hypothetical protein
MNIYATHARGIESHVVGCFWKRRSNLGRGSSCGAKRRGAKAWIVMNCRKCGHRSRVGRNTARRRDDPLRAQLARGTRVVRLRNVLRRMARKMHLRIQASRHAIGPQFGSGSMVVGDV